MLKNNVIDTLAERHGQYGHYTYVSKTSQLLKRTIRESPNYQTMPAYMNESLDMICNKLARILSGNYYLRDSWLDIEGYAKLVTDELDKLDAKKVPEISD
jgi:hypothetical protein